MPDTCRIWVTDLMWSPAVILSRSPSTQCFVMLPQPLTNSCMLRVKVDTILAETQDTGIHTIIFKSKWNLWLQSPLTWEHIVPPCHLHRLNRVCPPHQAAGLGRLSSSEGFGCCRHYLEMLLHREKEKRVQSLVRHRLIGTFKSLLLIGWD